MSILDAVSEKTVLTASLAYLQAGVSIIPLKAKLCALKSWSMAQQYRASKEVLLQWHRLNLLQGVGVVCGAVSGNLVVLDFDSHEAVSEFELTFPDFSDTLVISSGSRRGAHYYFYSKVLPPTTLVKNHELRANGTYVVGVPSPHPSGNLYEVQRRAAPMRLYCMDEIVQWIKSKRPPAPPTPPVQMRSAAAPHTGGPLSREEFFKRRYVETALSRQTDNVIQASEGNRNTQLYRSAIALGQIIGAGALPRFRVETELLYAAIRAGLPDLEAAATIKSGLDTGVQRPRQIPPPPAPRK